MIFREIYRRGLIPARAGTTPLALSEDSPHGAHPRSRGDHRCGPVWWWRYAGSSPLARGPRALVFFRVPRPGLIPARAGTTRRCTIARLSVRAHPRSRGDHAPPGTSPMQRLGSSPLARGPPHKWRRTTAPLGLIPARAGTTQRPRRPSAWPRAHPRSRGDHYDAENGTKSFAGSSPLARGPRKWCLACFTCPGLIPARAGTTRAASPPRLMKRAHPRSRGDHEPVCAGFHGLPGSSPLARGPHDQACQVRNVRGLIPARAGTTRR